MRNPKHTVDAEHWMWLYAASQPGVDNPGRWLATILAAAVERHKVLAEMTEASVAVAAEYPPDAEPIPHDDGTRPEEFGPVYEKVIAEPDPMLTDDFDPYPISVWDLPKAKDGGRVEPLKSDNPCRLQTCNRWIKAGQRSYFRTNDNDEKEYYHAYHFTQNYR